MTMSANTEGTPTPWSAEKLDDNELIDEFLYLFRCGRNQTGAYDRDRMRAVCAEISKRKLLDLKAMRESMGAA